MFDKRDAMHLAQLSALAFTDDELVQITSDMSDIIRLMDKIRTFDCNLESPPQTTVKYTALRNDCALTPPSDAEYNFSVPRVVEE